METNIKRTDKKRPNFKTILGLVVGLLIVVLVQQFLFKPPSFDKQMMRIASEVNESCPIMIDKETRLDNTIAFPGKTLQYNYTLINTIKDSVDTDIMEEYLKPMILNSIKTNPDLKFLRDNNATMAYNYRDMDGEHLLKLSFTPDQYK